MNIYVYVYIYIYGSSKYLQVQGLKITRWSFLMMLVK